MEYTVNKLAGMAGVSARTLRYYDQVGLLKPVRINTNNYRIYGEKEVDRLQQILFYKELDIGLDEIKKLLDDPGYDREKTLESHLTALLQKKAQIELLIGNVSKTLRSTRGETIMNNNEKFEGFKQEMIGENEKKYGKEIREKYGDEAVNASNAKINAMSEWQWEKSQTLSAEINENLKAALEQGNPEGETAQKVCDLHRQWLCMFWKEGTYTKEAHRNLGEMYVSDERFKAYYEAVAEGAAEFLRAALEIYCK